MILPHRNPRALSIRRPRIVRVGGPPQAQSRAIWQE